MSEKSSRHAIGAHVLHGTRDSRELTAAARRAFADRFEREADPEGLLSPKERARRAEHLRAAYFARLALRSAQVRRERAEQKRRSR